MYTLATHFKKVGADVVVAFGGTGEADAPTGLLAEKLVATGIQVISVRNFMRDISFLREFKTLFELVRIFKNQTPDVIHLNSSKAGGIGAFAGRLARVPKIVFTSHGLAYDEDRPILTRALIWFATWMTIILSHATIVISNDTYRRAKDLPFCARKVHLVYNGIAEIKFVDRDDARINIMGQPIRKEISWIGTIAEFTKNKGATYLIEAASILKKRGLKFRLVLIGDGEDLPKMKTQAIKSGLSNNPGSSAYASFPGFVMQAASRWMKAFAIFVLPSLKEGLPTVLLEAGQAGCAVIGTNIPGITDIIDDSTGVLVEPKNPVVLANALESLLRDPLRREKLGENLKARVAEKFSVEQMVRGTTALY
ncbi:glycosyltransferase [Candidatus Kaiserbacteria bacterium]|nr:glycosyltransferase [Candidatus Kaiserbacteria bacterium]